MNYDPQPLRCDSRYSPTELVLIWNWELPFSFSCLLVRFQLFCRMWLVFCRSLKLQISSSGWYLDHVVHVSRWVSVWQQEMIICRFWISACLFVPVGNLCGNPREHRLFPWHLCDSQPKWKLGVSKYVNPLCDRERVNDAPPCGHRAVLLLLLGDADPPTLLETSRWRLQFPKTGQAEWARQSSSFFGAFYRLLLTCLSQRDVCSLWLQRIRQQTSVRANLCFIMNSSTNSTIFLLTSIFSWILLV